MRSDNREEILDLYNTLIENGVIFYYGSESVSTGEITNLEFCNDGFINIEINGLENYEIEIEDFKENHSKEGANYHSWATLREFDLKFE